MGLRSLIRDFIVRMERSNLDYERERDQSRREERLADEIARALIDRGFELIGDQDFPMSSRLIELQRGKLAVRIESDRGWSWELAVAVRPGAFHYIHAWRELLDAPEQPDEELSLTRQAAYLMSRLDRIEAISTDPSRADETLVALHELAIARVARMWPGMRMRFEERLRLLIANLGDIVELGVEPIPGAEAFDATDYARGTAVFAARPDIDHIELRVGPDIAEAATRTPDTTASRRGPDWISFAPKVWDEFAADRFDAWFRVAWRFAGDR